MGWSFTEIKSKKTGLTNYVVHTSFRRENKVTSANCGAIKDIESSRKNFKTEQEFEEYIKAEGAKIYQKRKDDQKINHSFVLNESDENTDAYLVNTSQIYFRKIWDSLGLTKEFNEIRKIDSKARFQNDLNEIIFYLVASQIMESVSKSKAYDNIENYLIHPKNIAKDAFYDALDYLAKYADVINNKTYKAATKYIERSSNLYFYDVTTVNLSKYVKESDLVGMKKGREGIYGPIIQIGFLCDSNGLLIGLIVFKGNANEQPPLKELLTQNFGSSKLTNIVICTDAGLCSIKNKRLAERQFKGYIVTQSLKQKKISDAARDWALTEPFFYKKDTFLTKEQIIQKYTESKDNDEKKDLYNRTFYKSRWFKTKIKINHEGTEKVDSMKKIDKPSDESLSNISADKLALPQKGKTISVEFEQRLVVSFSLKYYFAQLKSLNEDKAKAETAIQNGKSIESKSNYDYRRFVQSRSIDDNGEIKQVATKFLDDKFEEERNMCGIYCQATNLDNDEHTIYKSSRDRWISEYIFRTEKSNLGFGAVYLRKKEHVIAHFEICLLAKQLLTVFIYKLYNQLNLKNDKIGKSEVAFTEEDVLEEIAQLKSLVKKDSKGETCLIACRKKNDLNKLMADTFRISLTTQVKTLDSVQKYLK